MSTSAPVIFPHIVPAALRPFVVGIVGFDETATEGRFRVQPAGTLLVLEISFTGPLHILGIGDEPAGHQTHQAFLSGFTPTPVRTAFFGRHASVQVYLTPSGAARLFRRSGRDLAGQVTPLHELEQELARGLPEKLARASDWRERFVLVDAALLRLGAAAGPIDPLVEWMWTRLIATGGQEAISDLALRSGWSARRVRERFTAAAGVSPKEAAGVIRFERFHRELGSAPLAELAERHGYADQSHLTRDVRRYSGESPSVLAQAKRPTPATALEVGPGR